MNIYSYVGNMRLGEHMTTVTDGEATDRAVMPPSAGPKDPADPGVDRVAEMFKLLGDPTRCRILFALLDSPDLRVLDIAAATSTTQTTVSAALRLLRTAGVVVGRRDGRTVHYRVADDHVAKLLTVSWQHSSHPGVHDDVVADDGNSTELLPNTPHSDRAVLR